MQKISLFNVTIPPMIKSLTALSAMLEKAATHAEKKKTAWMTFEHALLGEKLVFDQFDFKKQVQVVCDNAKGTAARLAEVEVPKHDDTEASFDELKARIAKTIDFLGTITPDQLENKEEIKIALPYFPGKYMTGYDYAIEYALPNFYFHLATAYNILRKNGVEIGKVDYLGGVPLRN